MSGFGLVRPPALASATVLREELFRLDIGRQQESWATARVVILDDEGRSTIALPARPRAQRPEEIGGAPEASPPADADAVARLVTRSGVSVAASPSTDAVLLGEADGTVYWALRADRADRAEEVAKARWLNLATVGGELPGLDAALFTTAVSLLTWHDRARYCARDGSPTRPTKAGWARVCAAKEHEEFPRMDPAIICLVHDGADQVLLGRQRTWPAGRFSVLAGFVEAGESLEACVVREINEEVGIDVTDVSYLGSQAWPFPRSLMLAFHAAADPSQPIRLDDNEIAEAMWVHRRDLDEALERGDWRGGGDGQLLLPGHSSIARIMIESWVADRDSIRGI
ncbi:MULTISPECIES: NAD(+) diphosphatase [unclassified Pseudofrankia]|uniref:NAD(+) diphosphatase n=1 Tax=unclassified Pseudofrankia TaxID=2994372 RepID=UPI0008DA6278|nr:MULTISPECIES: NAD(+) diphosphatase [unclassified Pseudofrankia]MDT3440531.1 NAD(+) diphosphatase [Pseudofrankia sp. BMG5.37]OHV47512.1 NADH pyrophosphatase [Pseudofrankia sp. BMG5.36]